MIIPDDLHPPTNLRVVTPDGVEHPVQSVYSHTTPDGLQMFTVVDAPPTPWVGIKADTFPGLTGIEVPAAEDEGTQG